MTALVLMYHQIVPDRMTAGWVPSPLADSRYGVRLSEFRGQMFLLRARGIPVMSLSDWISGKISGGRGGVSVIVTFDDGYESDYDLAAPVLDSLEYPATFFVSTGLLGRPGMLSSDKARSLDNHSRFRIGSHGLTHRFLSILSEADCHQELEESLRAIRNLKGHGISEGSVDLSAPGGRTGPEVIRIAKSLGYRALMTSEPGTLTPASNLFSIPRLPVMSHFTLGRFEKLLDPASLSFRMNGWVRRGRQIAGRVLSRENLSKMEIP